MNTFDQEVPSDEDTSLWGIGLIVGLFALLVYKGGWAAVVVVLAIIFMIFMHELGHYVMARRGGMKVTEFFLGFGPKIWSFKRGETEFGVKAIWAGAYVKVVGMNNLDETPPEDEARTYRQASFPHKLAMVSAGSGMHFLMALVMLFVLFVGPGFEGFGVDESLDDQRSAIVLGSDEWYVGFVGENSPAETIGIQVDDIIVGINEVPVINFDDVRRVLGDQQAGSATVLAIERGDESLTLSGELGESLTGGGFLGVSPLLFDPSAIDALYETPAVGPVDALGKTFTEFGSLTTSSISQMGSFFSPNNLGSFFGSLFETADEETEVEAARQQTADESEGDRILSIYGAARIGTRFTENGLAELLIFLVMLNVFIGVFNMVPLLPLDGGHVVIAIYERLRSRNGIAYHSDVAKAIPMIYGVMLVLVLVGVGALYLDITDPIV